MDLLLDSVGEKRRNHPHDVLLVQTLLKANGHDPGALDGICGVKTIAAIRQFQGAFLTRPDGVIEPGQAPGALDGICGGKTIAAIRQFQGAFLTRPDGVIEPGQATWTRLSAVQDGHPGSEIVLWSGDSCRWPQDKKLRSMDQELRDKVAAVLDELRRRKYQPHIFYGWRSVSDQEQLYGKGKSRLKFSFHNAVASDGRPNSYAADIIDLRYAWSPGAELTGFWKALGEAAKKHDLIWGGDWKEFPDPAHIQLVPNSRLDEVKRQCGPRLEA